MSACASHHTTARPSVPPGSASRAATVTLQSPPITTVSESMCPWTSSRVREKRTQAADSGAQGFAGLDRHVEHGRGSPGEITGDRRGAVCEQHRARAGEPCHCGMTRNRTMGASEEERADAPGTQLGASAGRVSCLRWPGGEQCCRLELGEARLDLGQLAEVFQALDWASRLDAASSILPCAMAS